MWELNTTRCYVTHRPHPSSHSCRRRIEPSSLYPASKISQCSIKRNMSKPLFWCAPPGRACQSLQQVEPPTLVYNHVDWAFLHYLRPRITWGKFSWVWYWRRKAIFSFPCYQLLPTQWTCTFENRLTRNSMRVAAGHQPGHMSTLFCPWAVVPIWRPLVMTPLKPREVISWPRRSQFSKLMEHHIMQPAEQCQSGNQRWPNG